MEAADWIDCTRWRTDSSSTHPHSAYNPNIKTYYEVRAKKTKFMPCNHVPKESQQITDGEMSETCESTSSKRRNDRRDCSETRYQTWIVH